jgi:RNA polymerase sigma factor (sigma-70 family)
VRVLGFCRNRLRTREDAEDAAQTTFCYALGALRRGVVPVSETAWLLKIARNVCLNRWAANSRRSRIEIARDPQVLQEVAQGREHRDEELLRLQEALQRLTESQRRAIVLREWQGLSYAEIGTELGLSQAAVETLIFRARRALARELRGDQRLRSGLDLGALLASVKSLLTGGGAVVKIAAGVAALATIGGVAGPRIEHRLWHHAAPPGSSASTSQDGTPIAGTATPASGIARAAQQDRRVRQVTPITADAPSRADVPGPDGSAPGFGGGPAVPTTPAPASPDVPAAGAPASGAPASPSQPPPADESPSTGLPVPPVAPPAAPTPPPAEAPALPAVPDLPPAPALPVAPALPPAPELPAAPALPPVNVPPATVSTPVVTVTTPGVGVTLP